MYKRNQCPWIRIGNEFLDEKKKCKELGNNAI